ncbi:Rha family transcriptional regulator [Bacillus wiedmannii]|uniref:Rha family transcriptional regulator n=1 Tax=Bacillus wiedmannii TaxID=1890302 RepID=UPI0021CF10EF|nr:Rha family transcriptional regulator [Bacillus wiedmannii]MCU5095013.1 Rha family transcriptional regulator [Bacillus wiedmannii]
MSQLQAIQHPVSHLVFLEGNELVTDSLTVAAVFNKRHADVLKSIESLNCTEDFRERNFSLAEYKDVQQKLRPKYLLKRDGLMFLVMGYTGEKAAHMKESYIYEFNRMEQQIKQNMHPLQMINIMTTEMMSQGDRLEKLEHAVQERMTVDYSQQSAIRNAVNRRVCKLWDEGTYNAEVHDTKNKLFAAIWRDVKNSFAVNSYCNIRQKDFDESISYIKSWRPRLV